MIAAEHLWKCDRQCVCGLLRHSASDNFIGMEPLKNPANDRAEEKARSRAEDQRALQNGKPPEELRDENAHFAKLRVRHVRDHSRLF